MGYQQARGIIPWKEGDELPEDTIARIRGRSGTGGVMAKTLSVDPLEQDQYEGQGSIKPPQSWYCIFCERENRWQDYECRDCERPRYYQLTQGQARAVARELNRLGRFEKELRELTAAHADNLNRLLAIEKEWTQCRIALKSSHTEYDRMYDKQPCGHERRFIVTGDDRDIGEPRGTTQWCALCGLESLRAHLREHHAVERWIEGATDETD